MAAYKHNSPAITFEKSKSIKLDQNGCVNVHMDLIYLDFMWEIKMSTSSQQPEVMLICWFGTFSLIFLLILESGT